MDTQNILEYPGLVCVYYIHNRDCGQLYNIHESFNTVTVMLEELLLTIFSECRTIFNTDMEWSCTEFGTNHCILFTLWSTTVYIYMYTMNYCAWRVSFVLSTTTPPALKLSLGTLWTKKTSGPTVIVLQLSIVQI